MLPSTSRRAATSLLRSAQAARPSTGCSSSAARTTPASQTLPRQQLPRATLRAPVARCPWQTPVRGYASVEGGNTEKSKNRAAIGPFSLPAAVLFVVTGGGLLWYFQSEKAKVQVRRKQETESAKVGRPRIGGPFKLTAAGTDPKTKQPVGATITHEDLLGSFSLIYFGFTNCPDICPEELDKMSEVVDFVEQAAAPYGGPYVQPVFVSCDPARDTVAATSKYIADFHPKLLGLTGSYEDVKAACKAYRVYFSTPPGADPNGDYLVDHSIFFYLMDPEGRFVDAFGRSVGPEDAKHKVMGYVKQWIDTGNAVQPARAKETIFADESRRVQA